MVGLEVHLVMKAFQLVHFDASYMRSDSPAKEATPTFLIQRTTEGHIIKG